jgi:hypothetical protein
MPCPPSERCMKLFTAISDTVRQSPYPLFVRKPNVRTAFVFEIRLSIYLIK